MTQNVEYKEWFTTADGQPLIPNNPNNIISEQDTPKTEKFKMVNNNKIGIVFKENNEPSENIYKKLFKSVPFKLNADDKAHEQPNSFIAHSGYYGKTMDDVKSGLVTLATNNQAKLNDDGNTNKYSRVPRVSHLPTVQEDSNISESFNISLIPNLPTDSIKVEVDTNILTRNNFLVKFSNNIVNWFKNSLNAIKTYIDTVLVTGGTLTVTGSGSSNIQIVKTDATSTDTNKFQVNVTVGISNDGLLSNNDANTIPSEQAVKTYVDNTVLGINNKADQSDLDILINRVNTINGNSGANLKANQSDLDAMLLALNDKVSKSGNETINGIKTFVDSPSMPNPVNNLDGVNKQFLDSTLTQYYTKTEVDALLAVERIRISNLENLMTTVLNTINNLPNNYYTKPQVDSLLSLKADLIHDHNGVYHPAVLGGITDNRLLTIHSKITTVNGIITNIST